MASLIDSAKALAVNTLTERTMLDIASNYNPDNSGTLRLPRSQRNFAPGWRKARQQADVIDSIFHNYPIGTAILEIIPGDAYHIYDARHRFETIWRFVNNKFKYKGTYYRDLSAEDREVFNSRTFPVVEIGFKEETTQVQRGQIRADIFIRFNRGVKLSDSDRFWANRDMPLVRATLDMLDRYDTKLSEVFGGIDVHSRPSLANWVALVAGLTTGDAANMTTSYTRLADGDDPLLMKEPDVETIDTGVNLLIKLYTRINKRFPVDAKTLKTYASVGYINAFYFADIFRETARIDASGTVDFKRIESRWATIIEGTRNATTMEDVMKALKTPGANNLNTKKVSKTLEKVDLYLATGVALRSEDEDSDEDEADA